MSETRFTPPESLHRCEVTAVDAEGDGRCVVRYRYPLGQFGCSRARIEDYGPGYWPPAVGDVIRVEVKPTVTLEARPR